MALAEANRLNIAAAIADSLPSVAPAAETPALAEGEVRVEDGNVNDEEKGEAGEKIEGMEDGNGKRRNEVAALQMNPGACYSYALFY